MANYPYYPNYMQPYQPAQPVQQPSNSIVWVQGESGAKSYLVGANQSVLLMDSEDSVFYIKSTDASGMPLPLRTFEYKERAHETQQAAVAVPQFDPNLYLTKDEFHKWLAEFKEEKNGESTV